jgi:toxin FitB
MPLLKFLADTNVISDWMHGEETVAKWLSDHQDEVALSTLTLAELRQGIELRGDTKARRDLERDFGFVLQEFEGCVWSFDEAAAFEWGRFGAKARNHPIPFDDSLIGAIARSMNVKVVTRNVKHFPGCTTINPWTNKETPAWQPTLPKR